MISSACTISSPPEPNTRQDQRRAADSSHPQKEVLLQKNESGQRQRGNRYSCGDESRPPPDADDHVRGSNAERNHGSALSRIDRPHDEKSGGEKCNQCQRDSAVAPTNVVARPTQRCKSRN